MKQQGHILIVGDIMLDEYWWGDVNYISPEAPVPVLEHKRTEYRLGGAANVANNIRKLGGLPILVGLTGELNESNDNHEQVLWNTLSENEVSYAWLVPSSHRPTIRKVRMMGGRGQQLLRVDYEKSNWYPDEAKELCNMILDVIEEMSVSLIVVSDYAKGVISRPVMDLIHSQEIRVIVDPKPEHINLYGSSYMITPNSEEFKEMVIGIFGYGNDIKRLSDHLNSSIVLTKGSQGITVYNRWKHKETSIPAVAKQVYDVTGAGDTIVAALAVMLNEGQDIEKAVKFANTAAGIVVGRIGTSTVTRGEVENAKRSNS